MPDLSRYRSALLVALLMQAAVLAITGVAVMDTGESLAVALIALVAFWVGAFMVIRRDLAMPGDFALGYIRTGYPVLLAVTAAVFALMW